MHVHTVRVVDLSSSQNLVDLCLQETGGLGVNCIIDSGGMCTSSTASHPATGEENTHVKSDVYFVSKGQRQRVAFSCCFQI